jgi:hypothetical protein
MSPLHYTHTVRRKTALGWVSVSAADPDQILELLREHLM